mgnify:CR=1 FL=1
MVLGALLDAGLPFDELKRALGSLAVVGISRARRPRPARRRLGDQVHGSRSRSRPRRSRARRRRPCPSTTVTSHATRHPHRSLPEIFALIDKSALSDAGRDRAKALFQRLAEAEAAIHQMPVEQVHLHEVGALDSIIDIVGAVFALEWFGADRIVCLAAQRRRRHGAVGARRCFPCRRRRR